MRRLLAVAVAVGLAGCAFLPSETRSLDGTNWRATLVSGQAPVPGREPTARFDSGKIMGSTGCNDYGALATIEGTKLTVVELGSTLIGCDDPVGSIEASFVKALGAATSIRFEGPNLVIDGNGGQIVFRPAQGDPPAT